MDKSLEHEILAVLVGHLIIMSIITNNVLKWVAHTTHMYTHVSAHMRTCVWVYVYVNICLCISLLLPKV